MIIFWEFSDVYLYSEPHAVFWFVLVYTVWLKPIFIVTKSIWFAYIPQKNHKLIDSPHTLEEFSYWKETLMLTLCLLVGKTTIITFYISEPQHSSSAICYAQNLTLFYYRNSVLVAIDDFLCSLFTSCSQSEISLLGPSF